jgi:hypothetical protein
MPDRPVVLDNTPLAALWVLGRLDLLRDLFQEVLIPRAEEEFLAVETSARREALGKAPWLKCVDLSHPRRALAYAGLDCGEAAVLTPVSGGPPEKPSGPSSSPGRSIATMERGCAVRSR